MEILLELIIIQLHMETYCLLTKKKKKKIIYYNKDGNYHMKLYLSILKWKKVQKKQFLEFLNVQKMKKQVIYMKSLSIKQEKQLKKLLIQQKIGMKIRKMKIFLNIQLNVIKIC
ncbi:hypothetical protein IMG5_196280 [Ichthyophthirius multifiliis]|uniref:Uncharacterized protein n=1 Tax=Ichthyophthirius multifiliis TaxID=5932 RepID=G0R543_ICHMU|nr:hypothetical protein IMG5_196280 [Ichthyophthirius multifiliis]EGR27445.1 hypothetical protein IMG5_196280 [Ichthyophthirius multifiliis]|eukprot:XP_004024355.1 hypothetical protein IMG5_196280 [Ichthyophthirius multifiliis]